MLRKPYSLGDICLNFFLRNARLKQNFRFGNDTDAFFLITQLFGISARIPETIII